MPVAQCGPINRGVLLNNLANLGSKAPLLLEGSGGWEGFAGASNSWHASPGGRNLADAETGCTERVTSDSSTGRRNPLAPPAWIASLPAIDASSNSASLWRPTRCAGMAARTELPGRRRCLGSLRTLFGKVTSYDHVKGLLQANRVGCTARTPITTNGPSSKPLS